jgi:type IV secretory pathway VirB10-like protein
MQRIALLLVAAALALVLYAALRNTDEDTQAPATTSAQTTETVDAAPPTTEETTTEAEAPPPPPPPPRPATTVRVTIRGGRPVGDHVHLHGYDMMRDVAPGRPAQIAFRATVAGQFELELEDRGLQIAELEVRP